MSRTFGAQYYRLKRDLEAPKKGMLGAIREFMPRRQPVAALEEIRDAAKKRYKTEDDIKNIHSQLALHPATSRHLESMFDTGDMLGCLTIIDECKSHWTAWEPYKTADTEIAGAFRVLESAYFVEPFGQISLRWNEALGAEIERLVAEIGALDDTERQQRINREDVEQTQLDREQKRQEIVNLFFMKRTFVPPPDRIPKDRSLTYSDDAGDYTVGSTIDNIREGRRRPEVYDSDKAALVTIITGTKALLKITDETTRRGADTSFGWSPIKGDLILPPEAIQKVQSMIPGIYFDKTRR